LLTGIPSRLSSSLTDLTICGFAVIRFPPSSAATAAKLSNAVARLATISSAMTSGAGRLAASSSDSSFTSAQMSRLKRGRAATSWYVQR
jgi:hypothetical protein